LIPNKISVPERPIHFPNTITNYKDDDENKINKILTLASLDIENSEWKLQKEIEGTPVYLQKPEGEKLYLIRGDATGLKINSTRLYEWLFPSTSLSDCDEMHIKGTAVDVEEFDSTHVICYGVWKMYWPLWNRDFVWYQLGKLNVDDKGTHVIVSRSVDHQKYPEQKGIVRGEILETGYIIRPNASDPRNKSDLSYVVQVDPRGYIPSWAVNMVAADQAKNVLRVKKYFEVNQAPPPPEEKPAPKSGEKKKKKKKKSKSKKNVEDEEEKEEEKPEEDAPKAKSPKSKKRNNQKKNQKKKKLKKK